MKFIKDSVAIVTGSGRGIGREIAVSLAKEGMDIVIFDVGRKGAEATAEEINSLGRKALLIEGDVSQSREVSGAVEKTVEVFGKIDILVNNVGITLPGAFEEIAEERWDRLLNVNLKGVFLFCQAVGKQMIIQERGNIINIASLGGHIPYPLGGAYSVSKAGVVMLTKQLAVEWGGHNIRVNAISPGLVRTPLTDDLYLDKEIYENRVKLVPLNRIGTMVDIANIAVFLASEYSSYINGQVFIVDGGFSESLQQQLKGRAISKKQ